MKPFRRSKIVPLLLTAAFVGLVVPSVLAAPDPGSVSFTAVASYVPDSCELTVGPRGRAGIGQADLLLGAGVDEEFAIELPGPRRPRPRFGRLPLSFELNQGQATSQTKYLVRGNSYQLFFAPSETAVVLLAPGEGASRAHYRDSQRAHIPRQPKSAIAHTVRMRLIHANPVTSVTGDEPLPGKVNYFIGNDPSAWHTNVPTFAKVRYRELYPGIDLVYYGSEGQLEYDFELAVGAEPNRIQMVIEGADDVQVGPEGGLRCVVAGQELRWGKPNVYQRRRNALVPIAGSYGVASEPGTPGTFRISFLVGPYDPTLALVIDPVLVYSTYLGDVAQDEAAALCVDNQGSAYVAGLTYSVGQPWRFPTTTNSLLRTSTDAAVAYVTKFSPEGNTLIYSTLVGGRGKGTGATSGATGLKLDQEGRAIVVGGTSQPDFPVQNAIQPELNGEVDGFVAKLSADGAALVFSTFLGGSDSEGISGVDIDAGSNVYVYGSGMSQDYPLVNPAQPTPNPAARYNGFLSKLAADGSKLEYSTYLNFLPGAMAVTPDGLAYVIAAVPIDADSDLVLTRVAAGGDAFDYSATNFLGGPAGVHAMALDKTGNLFLTGSTSSSDLLVSSNAFSPTFAGSSGTFGSDAFVAKFNPATSSLLYLTYLGGTDEESGNAIAVDASGNAYVAGFTSSTNFPVVNPIQAALSPKTPGNDYSSDAFVCKLNPMGSSLLWSSYFGGSSRLPGDGSDVVFAIALGPDGSVYAAGTTGSYNFPVTNAFQKTFKMSGNLAAYDAFLLKLAEPSAAPPPHIQITRAGNTITITWPAGAGFILESTDALNPGSTWVAELTAPVTNGDTTIAALEIEPHSRYFRLRSP